jgi:serine/threonine protein kinase
MEIGSLNVDVVRLLGAQILVAISQCHRGGVIHRDIKPENILLDSRNHIKLADFGTALIVDRPHGDQLVRSSIVGTPAFVAPELLKDGQIGFSSDIWAFGCTIFNLLTGTAPFEGENAAELMENISHGRFAPAAAKLPRRGKALIDSVLQLDPVKRLGHRQSATGYQSIRDHPFFAGVEWDRLSTVVMPLFTRCEEEGPPSVADDILAEAEKVVMEGRVERKRTLRSWKDRTLVLTSHKRLLMFNTKKKTLKCEIKFTAGAKVEVAPNGRDWTFSWAKGKEQAFRSKDGSGGVWAATILRESLKG